jgi:hypothetical protein
LVSRWAPDQVTGPLPLVENAALRSGWAWMIADSMPIALATSEPSSCGLSTLMVGYLAFMVSVNAVAASFSLGWKAVCVIATVPLPPSLAPIASAAAAPYCLGSGASTASTPGALPSGMIECVWTTGMCAACARRIMG